MICVRNTGWPNSNHGRGLPTTCCREADLGRIVNCSSNHDGAPHRRVEGGQLGRLSGGGGARLGAARGNGACEVPTLLPCTPFRRMRSFCWGLWSYCRFLTSTRHSERELLWIPLVRLSSIQEDPLKPNTLANSVDVH
jgi:hypothetical protein